MKGNEKVLNHLQHLLSGELMAADQYLIHSRMYEDMGFEKLHERLDHEAEEELEHADALIRRMLFLEAKPDVHSRPEMKVGENVPDMLKCDLDVEYQVTADLKAAIEICEQAKDYQTREILEELLRDTEEDHAYWLEKQLGLIEKVGLQNYLQSQM